MTSFGDLQLAGPMVIIFIFAVLALLLPFVPALADVVHRKAMLGFSLIGLAAAAVSNWLLAGSLPEATTAFSGMIAVDGYASVVHFVILIAAAGSLLMGHDHFERIDVRIPETYSLVLFTTLGMMLLASSNDLIMLFVALEVMSVALYVLCALNRGDWKGVEGAFKYLVLGAFSSAIMLYGVAFVYGSAHTTRIDYIGQWMTEGHAGMGDPVLSIGIALMLVGFAFKVAAVPFHMWSPDVYQGAPTPVTALMATGVKAAAFASFGRVVIVALLAAKMEWVVALWIMAAITMLVGNLAALVQDDLKRMLAYSSIAHAGYLLMALVAIPQGGVSENPRMSGLLFYLLAYAIMTIGAFAAVGMLTREGADDTRVQRLAGLGQRKPLVAAALALCLLSLAGIPPTMGFVGKFYLFAAAVEGGFVGLAVVGAIAGAIGVYYYLRPIVWMYMRPAGDELPVRVDVGAAFTLKAAAVALLVFGVLPGPVVRWCREAILSIWVG